MRAETQIGKVGSHFAVFSLFLVGMGALYYYRILDAAFLDVAGQTALMAILIPLVVVTFFSLAMSAIALILYRDWSVQVLLTAVYSIACFVFLYFVLR